MAGYAQQGDFLHHGVLKNGPGNSSQEEAHDYRAKWYFSRKEIEENSPSRRDGIDLKKEAYFRKSYCTFLQDLGMRLKVPQVTIATAIVFCHRFFLHQSHVKNDRRTVATVCMFLAGKVEETPRPLKDVILVSYEIIHKKDPSAVQRIKQKEVYEQQKELILLGERLVLATLGFDLNMHHPYKPLVEAIKKFKVAQNALAQVAWNFVNDGLRTSLCLQFKPHHIAAGAIFLAAKFLKVKLPSDAEKVWWQEFDVTPRQLEDVSNQMLELYEQNRMAQQPSSHATNEVDGSNRHPTAATNVSESWVSAANVRRKQSTTDDAERIHSHDSADSKSGVWDHNTTDCNGKYDDHLVIERELVNTVDDEKIRQQPVDKKRQQGWPKPLHLQQQAAAAAAPIMKPKSFIKFVNGNERRQEVFAEEGELSSIDEHDCPFPKLASGSRRRPDELWSDLSDRDYKRARPAIVD